MATRTARITLDIEAHPALTDEQLLHDLRRLLADFKEPAPARKAGRVAWHITGQAVRLEAKDG